MTTLLFFSSSLSSFVISMFFTVLSMISSFRLMNDSRNPFFTSVIPPLKIKASIFLCPVFLSDVCVRPVDSTISLNKYMLAPCKEICDIVVVSGIIHHCSPLSLYRHTVISYGKEIISHRLNISLAENIKMHIIRVCQH